MTRVHTPEPEDEHLGATGLLTGSLLNLPKSEMARGLEAAPSGTSFPGAAATLAPACRPTTSSSDQGAPGVCEAAAPVHQSDLPVDGRMPSRLGGAGRSEPTLLRMTWLPWPVRLIHTRGAL